MFAGDLARDFTGVRIAWSGDFNGYLPFDEGVIDLCRTALDGFKSIGCVVEEAIPDFPLAQVWESWLVLRAWQVGALLKQYYADPAHRALMKPEAQWEIERGYKISAYDVADALAVRSNWYQAMRTLFNKYDFFIAPSAQVFPFDIALRWPATVGKKAMDTYHRWMEVMIPVTMSGCPALNVPAGFNSAGLPMGLQIVAPNLHERACLELAYAYDRATNWVSRRPPALLG